nr:class I SAM-dependent methyltransferase [Mariprofundus ferrooxydans]
MKEILRKIVNYDNPDSIGSKFRTKRIKPFLSLLAEAYEKHGCVNIIDMGGTKTYWNIIPDDILSKYNVSITLVNLPGNNQPADEGRYKYVEGDCCDLSLLFDDGSFHIAHSNSVIEHVGDWDRMILFAKEVSRLAPAYFVQTPNFWFPVEPHCMIPIFHWLPRQVRVFLILKLNMGNWSKQDSVDSAVRAIDSAQLLNKRMFNELFKDAALSTERLLFMPKSIVAIRKKI